ncbi:hypothetical protein [Mesorhizobium sp.]|uniref:hypothetical protein n=1 Tax=Mesorhizobium sp. TaxID=1871066 RepID=UPI000FE2B3F8|nr:hypothetical protein [Mesorhizobium sp.]RWG78554.1 MAG: hypothetical protein EOQ70_30550 [Mesorhizobium sp.]RWK22550.1 MAG: hypothetical protein EOR41_00140 [Mesorhizobium sp.]
MTDAKEIPTTLLDHLRLARGSSDMAESLSAAELKSAYDVQRGPFRKRPYFVSHSSTARTQDASNRAEEWLARRLCQQGELHLPDGNLLRLIDYQFPLKAERSDTGIGKIDLIGRCDGAFGLIELKVGRSNESPFIALIELLAYAAVVRDNLEAISREAMAKGRCTQPLTTTRNFIVAPLQFWAKWTVGRRASRWAQFCDIQRELSRDLMIECLVLHPDPAQAGDTERFGCHRVDLSTEAFRF